MDTQLVTGWVCDLFTLPKPLKVSNVGVLWCPLFFHGWCVFLCVMVDPSSDLNRNTWICRSQPVTVITIVKDLAVFIVLSSKPNNHFQSLFKNHRNWPWHHQWLVRCFPQRRDHPHRYHAIIQVKMTNSEMPDVRIPHAGWCLGAFASGDSRWFDMRRGKL